MKKEHLFSGSKLHVWLNPPALSALWDLQYVMLRHLFKSSSCMGVRQLQALAIWSLASLQTSPAPIIERDWTPEVKLTAAEQIMMVT